MSQNQRQLLKLLQERSFESGSFQLASGDKSQFYIDGKMTAVYSEGAYFIGEVLYEETKDLEFDAIGGLEVGAIPLVTSAVISYRYHGREMEGFWVRDKVKAHGTQKEIEGNLRENQTVVIVDDVATRGESIVKAIKAVEKIGCRVALVLTLVDRGSGAKELFQKHGIEKYRHVFSIEDLRRTSNAQEQVAIGSRK